MKRIILSLILSVVLTLIIILSYYTYRFFINFKPVDEPFDKYLNYYQNEERNVILKKLNYKITTKYFKYDPDKYNLVLLDYPLTDNYNFEKPHDLLTKWDRWLKPGKRLIVFYDTAQEKIISESKASDASSDDKNKNSEKNQKDFANNYISYIDVINEDEININSKDPLLEDVNVLMLNRSCDLKINAGKIAPVLTIDGKIVIGRESVNGSEIIYISDYYIFSDKNILKNDNAILLNNLLKKYYKEEIIFDQNIQDNSLKKEKSFLELSSFPYLLIQIILFSIIFIMTYFKRYGLPLDKDKYRNRSVIRHLEAAGYFLQKTGKLTVIVKILDQYFLDRIQKIVKFKVTDEKSLIRDIEKRFDLSEQERSIFYMNDISNILSKQINRELFLRKFKKERLWEQGKNPMIF